LIVSAGGTVFIGAQEQGSLQAFELAEDLRELRNVARILGERPPFVRAVGLDHFEARFRQAGQIDERNFARRRGVTCQSVIIRPAARIAAALREAGIDAFLHLVPFGVVDDLGADLDLLLLVVEIERRHLAGGDGAVHGAQIAARLAAGRAGDLLRPFLVERLGRGVIANLAGAVFGLGRGDAIDEAPLRIDLGDRNEQVQV